MNTNEIIQTLKQWYHAKERDWLLIPELRIGTGYGNAAERRIDLFAINTQPAKNHKSVAYEIKVSRADFLKDINNPIKQRGARAYCNEFYYVAPEGVIKLAELPLWAGLIEICESNKKLYPRIAVQALRQERLRPSWSFICSMLRRIGVVNISTTLTQM